MLLLLRGTPVPACATVLLASAGAAAAPCTDLPNPTIGLGGSAAKPARSDVLRPSA